MMERPSQRRESILVSGALSSVGGDVPEIGAAVRECLARAGLEEWNCAGRGYERMYRAGESTPGPRRAAAHAVER